MNAATSTVDPGHCSSGDTSGPRFAVGCGARSTTEDGAAADPVEATFTVKAAPSSVVERAPQPTANLGPEVSPDEQCPGSTVDVAAFIGD